jgi:AcrR family transcriptional regulator/precorrin-6B methylase 2
MAYDGSGRRRQAGETRKRIYRSAEKLLTSHDPGEVSVDMIVKEAGVAKGSFYVHFASKDALFMELIDDKVIMVDAAYQSWLDALPHDLPSAGVLLSLIGRIADVLIKTIGVDRMKAVYRSQLAGDASVGAVANDSRELYAMFRRVMERGIAGGEFRTDLPPDLLARHMVLAIRGITYEWCLRHPDFDYKAQALAHFELLLSGLRAQCDGAPKGDASMEKTFEMKLENPARIAELRPVETLAHIGLTEGGVLCDIGAGTGLFTLAAASLTRGAVVALDIREDMLGVIARKAAEAGADNVRCVRVTDAGFGVAPGTADIVLMCTVLHEIADQPRFLADAAALLKPGGRLAVIEFHARPTAMGPPVPHRIGRQALLDMAAAAGLLTADAFDLGDNFYCAVFTA